jgi:fibro-slime domain-containing protein
MRAHPELVQGKLMVNYAAGMSLVAAGSDDIWLFVNGQRVIDLGGIHAPQVNTSTLEPYASGMYHMHGSRCIKVLLDTFC